MIKTGNDNIFKCSNRGDGPTDPFYFIPVLAGILSPENPSFTFINGLCFEKTEFSLEFHPSPETFD
jgi:hypothetical protein